MILGKKKRLGDWGREEESSSLRKYPEQGALLEAQSLPVEGRAAGQAGGGSLFPKAACPHQG